MSERREYRSMRTCRDCGAPIVWKRSTTRSGRSALMPFDPPTKGGVSTPHHLTCEDQHRHLES